MEMPALEMLALARTPASRRARQPRSPRAEEAYWRAQGRQPRPALALLVSLATSAGLILLLIGVAQV